MAQAITCDMCGAEVAAMLQTNTDTGEIIAVGPACLIPFFLGALHGLAAQTNPEVGAQFWPSISELVTSPAWGDHLPPPGTARKAKPRAGKTGAAGSTEDAPTPPGVDAASGAPGATESGAE